MGFEVNMVNNNFAYDQNIFYDFLNGYTTKITPFPERQMLKDLFYSSSSILTQFYYNSIALLLKFYRSSAPVLLQFHNSYITILLQFH